MATPPAVPARVARPETCASRLSSGLVRFAPTRWAGCRRCSRPTARAQPRPPPAPAPLAPAGPRRGDGEWRGSFVDAGFEPLRDTHIPNEQTLDRDGLV